MVRGYPGMLAALMWLTVDGPGASGRVVEVKGPLTIGRRPDNDLPLQDPEVSGSHARVTPQPDGTLLLEDLGSTNGTRVAGQRITSGVTLHGGEELRVGETILR